MKTGCLLAVHTNQLFKAIKGCEHTQAREREGGNLGNIFDVIETGAQANAITAVRGFCKGKIYLF